VSAVPEGLLPAFQGIIPSLIATCARDGEPNVTYLSQVHYVDPRRVALSCQFFNKTRRNVDENPYATVLLHHPVTFDTFRLQLRFDHAETRGPLFEVMAMRIQAIASHSGMGGVFRLLSADVYDVLACERVEGFLLPPDPVLDAMPAAHLPGGPLTELRGLQAVSERIARAADLEQLLESTLAALDELLGFSHAMVLVPDESGDRLFAVASRGYGEGGLGGEVAMGAGIIGTVAPSRRLMRVSGVGGELRYGRAIRGRVAEIGGGALAPEIPLPGLPDAQAQLAIPLLAGGRLLGVLAVESRDPLKFDEWDEAFLGIVGSQIAMGMDRLGEDEPAESGPGPAGPQRVRTLVYYRNDDCIFADGEYLVRNVPGKILWKLLQLHRREGRTEFTNRELRLDPSLGLPPVKDNLESRLILLRRRLAEKCPELRLVPVRRGRFALQVSCGLELVERETA
jgi:hypothetical protein